MSQRITTAHFLLALVPWIAAFVALRASRLFGRPGGVALATIAILLLALGWRMAHWPG
jgi:hypothetical protein